MKTSTTCATKAKQFLNLLQGYTKGIRMTAILVLLLMGVSNAWASNGSEGTSITVYTSGELFGSAWDASKSYIKIHVRRGDNDWMNYATMTETGKTYNGKKIYSYTFKEKWDGAQIYFEHWKTGSGSRTSEYGTDWANTSTLNGKLYLGYMDNGHRWATLCYDATIYFLKNGKASSWTTLKAHAWNEGYSSVTTTWPGTEMTKTDITYDENPIYSVTFSNPPYSKVIFNQGNSTNQSEEQTIPDHEGKIFDYEANKWIDYTYDVTVTFKANGGTDSDYTQTVKYNTSTALTANKFTRAGYSFNGWKTEANSGTSYADKANVTFKANTTLYAQWTENKYTVNIVANPAEAAKTLTSGPKQVGINAVNIATTTNIGYQFVNWTATAGITIYNPNSASTTITATKAGTVTANFKAQPATTVYLKTTANWESANARFAIYYWGANNQADWVDMTEVGCNRDYFKGEIPYGSTGFIFVRMNPKHSDNRWNNNDDTEETKRVWNQTVDMNVPTDSKNCFTITNDHWGEQNPKAEGAWAAFNPTVTLTLKSSSNGTYKITYEGKTYESSLTEDVIINDLPLNAEIIISDNANARPGYTFKKCLIKLGTNEQKDATLKTTYALCGTTTITADFVTEGPHTVYFKPNSKWTANSAWFAVYVYDEVGNNKWYKLMSQGNGYYSCDIEKGWSKLIFVRMNSGNATLSWNNKNAYQTFSHPIPVNRFSTYVLRDGKVGEDADEGYWTSAPTLSGAYRLRYVEQLVEHDATETWKVEINETKASHTPDDIIRKRANGRDTISLFINIDGDNPEVILQQYDGSKWVDIEAHMVNGPLEADAGKAMLPGRHNASPESNIDDFVYDNGIDAITESGVWNFVIVQDAESNASLLLKENDQDVTHKYTGNYYIRTDNATGGWNEYTHLDNIMKPSTNPESGYTHYYCKWIEIAQKPNVKFIVATDYCINVSKKFADDDKYTHNDGVLVENANVRWSWDENTGVVARAYIQGAYDGQNQNANIVLDYTTDGATDATDVILFDTGDWIYTKDVTVHSGATLVDLNATYPSEEKSGIAPKTQNFITGPITILEGMSGENYTVRVTYDFKNNKATTFLLPGTTDVATAVDVIIERVNQEKTTAVQSTITATNDQFTVCGVMSFTKKHLANNALHNDLRQFYWISFPFKVNLEDVYGFGVYGKHWILETYNGERRAKDGLWLDSPSFWEYILDPKGVTLEANKGYLLCLDSELLSGTSDVFTNTDKVSLYFPAKDKTSSINTNYTTEVTIHEHICIIERADRNIYDSNWNLIGVPSYANHTQTTNTENLQYFYDYQYDNQTGKMKYATRSTNNSTNEFRSMYAYFVQWGGTLNWSTVLEDNTPKELAAKQNAAYEAQEHNLRLELQKDYKALDQTFVDMQEDGVTAAFDLNKDMTKIINAGANIYTLAGTEMIQLAGNSLPIANTVIPVGVQIATAGEYTFAMPDGTDGIVVELIDYETNIRTNLMLDEYTVDLAAGTNEARFALHVKPNKVTTSLEDGEITTTNGKVRKFLIDGVLYLQKDGNIYDAQGKLIR